MITHNTHRFSPPIGWPQGSNGAGKLSIAPWGAELPNMIDEAFNFGTNNKFTFTNPARNPVLVLNSRTGLVTGIINAPATTKRRISAVLTGGLAPCVLGYATGATTTLRMLGNQ